MSATKTVNDYISDNNARYPERAALVMGNHAVSYGELISQTHRIANCIIARGVPEGSTIAILTNDCRAAILHILGIIRAGCIYLPLDPEQPTARIGYVLRDANAALVFADARIAARHSLNEPFATIIDEGGYQSVLASAPDALPQRKPHDLAYVMYTSGSTGQPKGVVIAHRNLAYIYECWEFVYGLSSIRSHLQMASLSFDVFAGDWIRALCSGATLHICPREALTNPSLLYRILSEAQIECAEFVPVTLRKLYQYALTHGERLDMFRLLICGSDTWYMHEYRAIKKLLASGARFVNSYGTTEVTIDSMYFEPSKRELETLPDDILVPLGRPLPGTSIAILDSDYRRVSEGNVGELFLGGPGVGVGYLGEKEAAESKFMVSLPRTQLRGPWFRTGDRASIQDGTIRFHGRTDTQVKVAGKRMDLAEVEAAIRQHDAVAECVVLTTGEETDKQLVAFIQLHANAGEDATASVSRSLTEHLPQHMLPTRCCYLNHLPVTRHGKLDRRALQPLMVETS